MPIKLEDNFLLNFHSNCQSLKGMLIEIRNLLYMEFYGLRDYFQIT